MRAGYLSVRNLEDHQHYRDRNPPWVKLHQSILEDYWFTQLPDATKAHVAMMLLLASRTGNKIPADPKWIAARISATGPVDLALLMEVGFLEEWSADRARARWASRYVPDKIRAEVVLDASGKCQSCGSKENIEIDHIIPISKGGTSDRENLQVLCRSCNRTKRLRSFAYADAEGALRSIVERGRGRGEDRVSDLLPVHRNEPPEDPRAKPAAPHVAAWLSLFPGFWAGTTRRGSRKAAERAWAKLAPKNGSGQEDRVAVILRLYTARVREWRDEGRMKAKLPHISTFLNGESFELADVQEVERLVIGYAKEDECGE